MKNPNIREPQQQNTGTVVQDSFLCAAVQASLAAGAAISEIYQTCFSVDYKEDRSPLTHADRKSHEIITRYLQPTGLPILSEEGKDIPFETRSHWELFWLVDPLDGTKEFVKRNGEFTVNIALISKTSPVMGVIYIPEKRTLYFAVRGSGVFRQSFSEQDGHHASVPLPQTGDVHLWVRDLIAASISLSHPSDPVPAGHTLKIIGSRSHATPELGRFASDIEEKYGPVEFVAAGSALKFCLVAEGSADIYPRFGPTMEWDTAAGQCIVEESGGSVVSMDDHAVLSYNKQSLKNPDFLCRKTKFAGESDTTRGAHS